MANSKSQRMKEYRARKKAQLHVGDEWLKHENVRVKAYFKPVSELSDEDKYYRQAKNRLNSLEYHQKRKCERRQVNEESEPLSKILTDRKKDMSFQRAGC